MSEQMLRGALEEALADESIEVYVETDTAENILSDIERSRARIAELEARLGDAELRLGDPRDIPCDTGHPDADRVISGLCSDDPQFHTMEDAAVLIRRLVADAKGPDGFASWKDAAVHERQARVAMEARLAAAERDAERLDFMESGRYENGELFAEDEYDHRQAIYRVDGNRNDREFKQVGSGMTLRAAIDSAREG